MSSGTVMSMPPMMATAVMVTSASANRAWVRSMSTPPMIASAVNWVGTTHGPARVAPDRIPPATVDVGVPPILAIAEDAAVGGVLISRCGVVGTLGTRSWCPGRSQVTGSSSLRVFAP